MPNVHVFEDTKKAYDTSQWNSEIKNGDVLVGSLEGVIGFLYLAWPVAVVMQKIPTSEGPYEEHGEFHLLLDLGDFLKKNPQYRESVILCLETAEQDADVTGNAHWASAQSELGHLVGLT